MELLLLVGSLVLLILVGAPIGVTMAVLSMIYIAFTGELPLSTVPYQMYEALAHAPLVAIPFFLLTGELMNSGQITERLLVLSRELVGRFRGAMLPLTIPIVIVGGMVLGVFTSTEAGAVTAIVAALISAVAYRTLNRSNVRSVLTKSVEMTASVFIIIAAAGPFSWLLNQIGALQGLGEWLTGFAGDRVMFITALVGC